VSPRTTTDWDAKTYDRLAAPQEEWGRRVLERFSLEGSETVLDAGCGSGRVTKLLLERLPRGQVIGVDGSPSMIETARESLAEHGNQVRLVNLDLLELSPDLLEAEAGQRSVDVVFSNATFHWIADHDRLFEAIHSVLRPGGRLVAQCGGHGNIARVLEVVGERPGTWLYATPEDTERRLRAAGFRDARAWLQPKPTVPDDMVAFVESVILHGMPPAEARPLAEKAAAELDALDYVRLNIEATA
jgi:trans-aconitate 2-methyltransferase